MGFNIRIPIIHVRGRRFINQGSGLAEIHQIRTTSTRTWNLLGAAVFLQDAKAGSLAKKRATRKDFATARQAQHARPETGFRV